MRAALALLFLAACEEPYVCPSGYECAQPPDAPSAGTYDADVDADGTYESEAVVVDGGLMIEVTDDDGNVWRVIWPM